MLKCTCFFLLFSGYEQWEEDNSMSFATAVGCFATVSASNKVRIGSSTVTVVEGQVGYSFPSDARFKENIQSDVPGLAFIMKLNPVSYHFDHLRYAQHIRENTEGREEQLNELSLSRSAGFLAQEVENTVMETGFTSFQAVHAPTNPQDTYSLGYSEFVVPLVKAVQEQQQMIEDLKKMVEEQQKQMEQQQQMMENQQQMIKALQAKL